MAEEPWTHWGWVTHICVSKLTIIGSDNNGLSPGQRQAIIWNLQWNLCTFIQENVICEMAAILSWLQCVKTNLASMCWLYHEMFMYRAILPINKCSQCSQHTPLRYISDTKFDCYLIGIAYVILLTNVCRKTNEGVSRENKYKLFSLIGIF